MEVLNDLLGYDNMKIYQDDEDFCFSLDSVLLANFATINPRFKNIIDLGTGTAPIPLILSTRTKAKIVGVDIKKYICELARKTISYNNLSDQIEIKNENINNLNKLYDSGCFDLVVSNPPYFKYKEHSIINEEYNKSIARHEILINLEQLIKTSSYLLKNNGYFAMVHQTERMVEIIEVMKKHHLEPKRIQFIYPGNNKDSSMFLIEGVKDGKKGLKLLNPIYVHNSDNTYTKEILKLFQREEV